MLSRLTAAACRARALPGGGDAAPLLACLLVAGLAACSEEVEREPLPSWVENQETVPDGDDDDDDDVPPPDLGAFALYAPDKEEIGWDIKVHAVGDFDAPCTLEVPEDYRSPVELECMLEIPELALHGGGLDFGLAVAPERCDFVTWHHYMYEAWPVGPGPSQVSIIMDEDGIVSETNAINGVAHCEYDHGWTHFEGPNCCYGAYTYSVIDAETGDYLAQPETRFWGGDPASCFNGAAYLDPEASFSEGGWPMGTIVPAAVGGVHKRFHWDNLSAEGYVTNVPYANYYDPANHDGDRPAGLQHEWAQPYYLFQCWDKGEEKLAAIKLVVREWNTLEEFYKGAEGDPHVQGTEPAGGPLDDRADWGVATPGSEMYIMDQQ